MRVIAGTKRSLPLKAVPGKDTRPTQDRIKETLFNIISPYISECRFLDLFAGSGGIGIEALSRGAEFACFTEQASKAVETIKYNLGFTGFGKDRAVVVKGNSLEMIRSVNPSEPYDVVFIDPPYNHDFEHDAMKSFKEDNGWVHKDTLFIIEASLETDFSWTDELGYEIMRVKEYKTNKHIFLKINKEA